jgi:hypothetical protein
MAFGALQPEGARRLLADADLPGVGNVLESVADVVEVREEPDGEQLYVRLGFGA